MEPLQVDRDVQSITFLKADADGDYKVTRLTQEGRRKKQSRALRPIEKMLRRAAEAQARAALIYLDRHERSNRRKKNGWVWDLYENVYRATKAGKKRPRVVLVRQER